MQFCYRGAKYQAEIESVIAASTETTARFLGQTYTLHKTNYNSPSMSELYKNRGIVYRK